MCPGHARPGMTNAGAQFARVLEDIGQRVLRELEDLPDGALNRAVALPEANTLFALATHLVGAGEFWVLTMIGGREIARDREAEFHASGQYQDLERRYSAWMGAARDVLWALTENEFDRLVSVPPERRAALGDQPLTVRTCVLHAIEHSALHLGHIQLTRTIITQARSDQGRDRRGNIQ